MQAQLAREPLLDAMTDDDPEVAALAVRLLGEVSESSWEKDEKIKKALQTAASHRDPRVRVAAQLLGGDFEVEMSRQEIKALVMRTRRPPEPTDELWALELAYRFELRELIPALKRRAYGLVGISFDPARFMALVVLSGFEDPEARLRVKKQLQSKKTVNRHAVMEAIITLRLASMVEAAEDALESELYFEEALRKKFRNFVQEELK